MPVAAMVLSILGLVTCWVPILGPLLSVIGLILGIVAMKSAKGNKGIGIVGVVVGAIAFIVGSILTVLIFVGGLALLGFASEQSQEIAFPPTQQIPAEAPIQQ